jgi:O-antigen/teichoic acid export membrane protein
MTQPQLPVPPTQSNKSIRSLLKTTFLLALLGKVAAFGMIALLARALEVSAFGIFIFAQGAGQLAGRFAALGWPTLMTRLIALYRDQVDPARLRGLLWAGNGVVLGASVLGGLALLSSGMILLDGSELSDLKNGTALGLAMAALLCPAMALRQLRRQQLAALRRPGLAMTIDEVLPPLAVVALVLLWEPTAALANFIYAVASFVGVLIASLVIHNTVRAEIRGVRPVFEMRPWSRIAFFCVIDASAKLLMNKTDVVMLPYLSDFEQTGLYGAAFRLTYLTTFPQVVVSLVMSPRYAIAHGQGDQARLRRDLVNTYLIAMVTTALAVAPMILMPDVVLHLAFGGQYSEAGTILVVLTVSQSLAALGLPLTAVAMMTGQEKFAAGVTWLALIANLWMNFVLIPLYGALGAAIASMIAIILLVLPMVLWIGIPIFRSR